MARSEGKPFIDKAGAAHNTPAFDKRKKKSHAKAKTAKKSRRKNRS